MKRLDLDPEKLKILRPPRSAGSTSHHDFLDMLAGGVRHAGCKDGERLCAVQLNGNASSMVCMVEVKGHRKVRLPQSLSLWVGGFNSTVQGVGSYVYGCVAQHGRAVSLYRKRAMWKGLSLTSTRVDNAVDDTLFMARGFPATLDLMAGSRLDYAEKTRMSVRLAEDNVVSYGRLSTVLCDMGPESMWSFAMKFHDALDRGPAIIQSCRMYRMLQMWRLQCLMIPETEGVKA